MERIDILSELNNCHVQFGLNKDQICTIDEMIQLNFSWKDISRKIGWDEKTVIEFYTNLKKEFE